MALPRRRVSFLIVIGLFGLGLGFIVSVLDPLIYSEKTRQLAPPGLKNSALSLITIMALLVALIAQPVIGRWSDRTQSRWGRRIPFLSGGVLGLSLALLAIAWADNLFLLILAAMVASGASNTIQSAWQALVPDYVPIFQRGAAAAIKTLLEAAGAIIGLTVAGLAITQSNLALAPLSGIALFSLILLITLYTLVSVRNPPLGHLRQSQAPADRDRGSPSSRTLSAYLARLLALGRQTPAFFWWLINRLLFWSAGIALRTFILNYLEDVRSLSVAEVTRLGGRYFFPVAAAGVFLLVLGSGLMADRLGRRPMLITAGLLACAGTLLLTLTADLRLLLAGGGLIIAGAALFATASWALATDIVANNEGAFYLGIANGATVLGSIGGRLGGPLIDGINQISDDSRLGYLIVFCLAALFFAGSSAVVLKIPTVLRPKARLKK